MKPIKNKTSVVLMDLIGVLFARCLFFLLVWRFPSAIDVLPIRLFGSRVALFSWRNVEVVRLGCFLDGEGALVSPMLIWRHINGMGFTSNWNHSSSGSPLRRIAGMFPRLATI